MTTNDGLSLLEYVLSHRVIKDQTNTAYLNDLLGVLKVASYVYHYADGENRVKLVKKMIEIGRVIPDYGELADEYEDIVDGISGLEIKPPNWRVIF